MHQVLFFSRGEPRRAAGHAWQRIGQGEKKREKSLLVSKPKLLRFRYQHPKHAFFWASEVQTELLYAYYGMSGDFGKEYCTVKLLATPRGYTVLIYCNNTVKGREINQPV